MGPDPYGTAVNRRSSGICCGEEAPSFHDMPDCTIDRIELGLRGPRLRQVQTSGLPVSIEELGREEENPCLSGPLLALLATAPIRGPSGVCAQSSGTPHPARSSIWRWVFSTPRWRNTLPAPFRRRGATRTSAG